MFYRVVSRFEQMRRSMSNIAEKVTAFVTRPSPDGHEILLFKHPTAGIQLPAGTVEADEPHADAAAREAREETGLVDLPAGRFLDAVTDPLPDHIYLVATTTRVYTRPDVTSVDWASIRRGMPVICNRPGPDFCHVTYLEHNEEAEPDYVSYQITGWAPTAALTRQVTRYFYHFPHHGQTADTWWVDTDNHRFRLFWASLAKLPPIIEPQRWWLNILLQSQTTDGNSA
jgi:8-oxo-dGTP pyrophosphatase MutT (NUDIX family)